MARGLSLALLIATCALAASAADPLIHVEEGSLVLSVDASKEIFFRKGGEQRSLDDILDESHRDAVKLIANEGLGDIRSNVQALNGSLIRTNTDLITLSQQVTAGALTLNGLITDAKTASQTGLSSLMDLITALTARVAAAEQKNVDLQATLTATKTELQSSLQTTKNDLADANARIKVATDNAEAARAVGQSALDLLAQVTACIARPLMTWDTAGKKCVSTSSRISVGAQPYCNGTVSGTLSFNTNSSNLELCDGVKLRTVSIALPGSSSTSPANNCGQVLASEQPNGFYWLIDAVAGAVVKSYCYNGRNVWWPFSDGLKEPIAYFPLDDSLDPLIGNYKLSLVASTTAFTSGRVEKSLIFNGANFYKLSIPDSVWRGAWTVSGWFSIDDTNKGLDNAILGHGIDTPNNGLHLGERAEGPYFGFHSNDITETLSLSETDWNFLVFVTDGKGKKQIYINGHLREEGTGALYGGSGNNTELGRYPYATAHLFLGRMDDISIFDYALTAADVDAMFKRHPTKPATTCAEAGTLKWPPGQYRFTKEDPINAVYCSNGKAMFTPPFATLGVPLLYYPLNGDILDHANIYDPNLISGIDANSYVPDAVKGTALRFTTASFFQVTAIRDWAWTSAHTFAVWVKYDAVSRGSDNAICGHGTATPNLGLHYGERSAAPYMGFHSNDATTASGTTTAGRWYHLVMSYDGVSRKRIYINGVKITDVVQGKYSGSGANTRFGRYWTNSDYNFVGLMDEIMLFNREFSEAEVSSFFKHFNFAV